MRNIRTSNNTISTIKRGEKTLNPENRRLKEIQTYKTIYHQKLQKAETILEKDLIEIQITKLNQEEKEILKRCNINVS
jgi:hypothetical protein